MQAKPTEFGYYQNIRKTIRRNDLLGTVNATKIAKNQYKILNDNEFTDYIDPLYLHEFYPGDTVELEPHNFADGKKGEVAKNLISKGTWPNRDFNEFKFKASLGQLRINQQTADMYKSEIDKVKKEHSAGQFFYPVLLDTVNKLDSLITTEQR